MKSKTLSICLALLASLMLFTSCDENGGESMIAGDSPSLTTSTTYTFPADRKYTDEHEWIRIDPDGQGTVGVTPVAIDLIGGDVVELSQPGDSPDHPADGSKRPRKTLEQILKSLQDKKKGVTYPVAGAKTGNNSLTAADPTLVGTDPLGNGWLFRLDSIDLDEYHQILMTAEEYELFIGSN